MALSGWNSTKKIKITIPQQAETLTDFPLLVNLTAASGVNDFDCTPVFTELGTNRKKIAVEIGGTGGQCFVEIERWDNATNSAQLWVRVPAVSSTADTELYLYYDSAHADNDHTIDTSWSNVVLALPMNGPNLSTSFIDMQGKTVTPYGNAKISTTQSKFGGSSAYFDGSGDYINVPTSTDFDFGSSDYTIELWFYPIAFPSLGTYCALMHRWDGINDTYILIRNTAGVSQLSYVFSTAGDDISVVSPDALSLNTWYHVVVCRVGNTIKMFVNGVQKGGGATYTASLPVMTTIWWIGSYYTSGYFNGYIDDLRFIKGVARYTEDFTPPAQSFIGQVGDINSEPAKQVWSSNYAAVYHLSQDPSITVKNSTINDRNLTPSGSMTTGQLVDGPTGKAISFDGSNDSMASANGNLSALQTAFTVEAVAKLTATATGAKLLVIGSEAAGAITLDRYTTGNYLNVGVWGDTAASGATIDSAVFKTYGQVMASNSVRAIANGSIDGTTNSITMQDLTADPIVLCKEGATYYPQQIRSIRISQVARSAAWLTASYNSDFDQLVAFTSGIPTYPVFTYLDQYYSLTSVAFQYLEQVYGIKALAIITQYYGDAPVVLQKLEQYYGDGATARRMLVQMYGDAVALRKANDHPYALTLDHRHILNQSYAIAGSTPQQILAQLWDIKSVNAVQAAIAQPFAILGEDAQISTTTVSVTVGGISIDPLHVSVEASQDQYCLSCEVTCADQADYLACERGADLDITINGEAFKFFIESKRRSRSHGSSEYSITGLSKTALLDAPYATPLTTELTGMASDLVKTLATGHTVDWRTIDWFIPPSTLLPAGETPLAIIRTIAAASGAILQTAPDGTLIIAPQYPVSVTQWEAASVATTLSDSLDFFTVAEEFDHRPGYNKYLVSDQMTSQNTLRLEEETLSETVKLLRGYKTPWSDAFTLRHTGGAWVIIEPLGTETAEKTEVVEFVAGEGKTRYPLYSIVSLSWLQTNLGSITPAEDGRLSAAVEGESLLSITYTTKALKWQVANPNSEKVQIVAEEVPA